MNILDRYFLKKISVASLFSLIGAVVVILCLQMVNLSGSFVKYNASLWDMFLIMQGLLLSLFPLVLPVAFLFALLYSFSYFSINREFVASSSLGFSPLRVLRVPVILGLVFSMFTFFLLNSVAPQGDRIFWSTLKSFKSKKAFQVVKSGTFTEGLLDLVFYVKDVDKDTEILNGVFIYDDNAFSEDFAINAEKGKWLSNEANEDTVVLKLENGSLVSNNFEKKIIRMITFDEYTIFANIGGSDSSYKKWPQSMSLSTLFAKKKSSETIKKKRPYWVEIARRFAVSLISLLFVPLAFVLSVGSRRTAKNKSLAIGVVIVATYWTIYSSTFSWLRKTSFKTIEQEWFNWLVAFAPNFIMIALIVVMWRLKGFGLSTYTKKAPEADLQKN